MLGASEESKEEESLTDNHTHLAKNVTIPAGDSIEIVQGKILLESGEDIGVTASAASAVDVTMSILKDA